MPNSSAVENCLVDGQNVLFLVPFDDFDQILLKAALNDGHKRGESDKIYTHILLSQFLHEFDAFLLYGIDSECS